MAKRKDETLKRMQSQAGELCYRSPAIYNPKGEASGIWVPEPHTLTVI